MNIGEKLRTLYIEPIEEPQPEMAAPPEPIPEPLPDPERTLEPVR
jgi:hypothetical protein